MQEGKSSHVKAQIIIEHDTFHIWLNLGMVHTYRPDVYIGYVVRMSY